MYSFQDGIPEGAAFDFEVGIFHDPKHIRLQSETGWHSFSLVDLNRSVAALIHIHIHTDQALSPLRSSYGSFLFSESIEQKELLAFVTMVEHQLKKRSVKIFTQKCAPFFYNERQIKRLEDVLIQSGYRISVEETSAAIKVGPGLYESILHRSKKSRLRKCHEMDFQFAQSTEFGKIYNFLNSTRQEKGYSLSMSWNDLERVIQAFPDRFLAHEVILDDELVAACISIQVQHDVLYAFYYDHHRAFDQVSPVVFLCEGIYKFCQQCNIRLMDLGTSNTESLLNFKLSLGGIPTRKLTFIKDIV